MSVIIDEKRLADLERAERLLDALEANGVDCWDGYDLALADIKKGDHYDSFLAGVAQEIVDSVDQKCYEPSERGAGWALDDSGYEAIVAILRRYKLPLEAA